MIYSRRAQTLIAMTTAAVFAAALPFVVLAAGGGGGGGGAPTGTGNTVLETCSQDVWSCGEWGTCGLEGQQTRECRKTVDCPTTESPEPSTVRSCVSSPTPAPALEPAPAPPPAPEPMPSAPARAPIPRVSPSKSTPTSSPPPAPSLICGNIPTLEERVRCRIGLDKETLERELAIQYLPEECRAIREDVNAVEAVKAVAGERCIERYRNLRPCWAKPIGSERLACVRGVLGVPDFRSFLPNRTAPPCGAENLEATRRCEEQYRREKVYPYITFRFYDLEERAEGLKELGAPMDLVVKFVVAAEQAKQDFNAARSKVERIAIIRRVQSEWRAFVAALPEQVKTRARQEGIGSSY